MARIVRKLNAVASVLIFHQNSKEGAVTYWLRNSQRHTGFVRSFEFQIPGRGGQTFHVSACRNTIVKTILNIRQMYFHPIPFLCL